MRICIIAASCLAPAPALHLDGWAVGSRKTTLYLCTGEFSVALVEQQGTHVARVADWRCF